LEFLKNGDSSAKPAPFIFQAVDEDEALLRVGRVLDLDKLTPREFRESGGKRLMYGDNQIFPPLKAKAKGRKKKKHK
jgi:hypothetical protein